MNDFIWAGDVIVSPSSGQRFKVKKVNPANFRCVDEQGGGWNIRRSPNVRKDEDQSWPEDTVERDTFALGDDVTLEGLKPTLDGPGYVVIKLANVNEYNITKRNDGENTYLRGIDAKFLRRG